MKLFQQERTVVRRTVHPFPSVLRHFLVSKNFLVQKIRGNLTVPMVRFFAITIYSRKYTTRLNQTNQTNQPTTEA